MLHHSICCRFAMKFYMLAQISFWLHCYPELYFMKAKKVNLIWECLKELWNIVGTFVDVGMKK